MNVDWRLLAKVSFVEGLSLLLLLLIAMPMKYLLGIPLAVKIVGTIHGILFMGLVALIALVARKDRWPNPLTITALISSSVPFGMIFLDRQLKAKYNPEH